MNGPPGMPIQSMPAGWLKQITLTKEKVAVLEKQIVGLQRQINEITAGVAALALSAVQPEPPLVDGPAVISGFTQPPVKRGPGRPRKVPQA